jgi:acetyl-CoA carboxylase biotin carboxyl carrier protein
MSRVEIESEVTGNVWKVEMKVGDRVALEDVLMILESMKMEIPVESTCSGTIVELLVKEEDSVNEDQVVAIIESD